MGGRVTIDDRVARRGRRNRGRSKSIPGAASLCLIAAVLSLAGCASVGSDYVRPASTAPSGWNSRLPEGLSVGRTDPADLSRWWATLGDETLSVLVERAVAGNLDAKKARARVREARARRGVSGAGAFPTVSGTGSATWTRQGMDSVTDKAPAVFSAGFDAGWELDIWGGTRRSVEAADADVEASREGLHDVLVSLLAEVALNYVEARTYQARLSVAEESAASQEESYRLAAWRREAGLVDELAVQQARYALESTRSQVPVLRAGLAEAFNRLAVLLGEQPGRSGRELEERKPVPDAPASIIVGVPSDVLRHRPDVRRAERELAAQTARVGAATADLYPKLSLAGSFGISADRLPGTGSWSLGLGPRISLPIFNAGSLRAQVAVRSAVQEQALIVYEATVLAAIGEIENILAAFVEEQERRGSLERGMEAAREAALLAENKFRAGLSDFGSVLDAQRSLLSFRDQLAQDDGTRVSNVIRLYKALGGGWTGAGAAAGQGEQ